MDNSQTKSILERISKLEVAVFKAQKRGIIAETPKDKDFSGATGGIRFLISKAQLDKKLGLGEVRSALAGADYHYSTQAVQMALNRLSKPAGPLVGFKEAGKKVYVKRK